MANGDRVSMEQMEADVAAASLPGAALGWNSMLAEIRREGNGNISWALRPELKNLKPPTLYIWGDKDVEPPSDGQEMAALSPRARCEVVPDSGHMPWLDQPERCTKLMVDFLKSA